MLKSINQQIVERNHGGKDIKDILIAEFERARGTQYLVPSIAIRLQISSQTLRNWCRDLEIDIEGYTHG